MISRNIRTVDTLCRYGGEEFVVLLAETGVAGARQAAEKLRAAVENSRMLPKGNMTISVGVCDLSVADGVDHWLNLADGALYLAKRNGRNRVELAEAVGGATSEPRKNHTGLALMPGGNSSVQNQQMLPATRPVVYRGLQ